MPPLTDWGSLIKCAFYARKFVRDSTDIFFKGTIQLINAGALFVQLNLAYFISIFYMPLLIKLTH